MEIIGHERRVNFPIGCPLLFSSLQDYGYQRYADSQRRNCNGYEVLRGLEPTHGDTILLQSAKRGRDVTQFAIPAWLWPDFGHASVGAGYGGSRGGAVRGIAARLLRLT